MEEAAYHRIAELIPHVQKAAVDKDEEELKKAQKDMAFQGGGNEQKNQGKAQAPIVKEEKIGRNELVMITNGSTTETLKYKKAEQKIASGEWTIVTK